MDCPNQNGSDSDSDILEIAVIPPKENLEYHEQTSLKRRKSSPLLDPIPTYTPTPLHILDQRSKTSSTTPSMLTYDDYDNIIYNPTPLVSSTNDDEDQNDNHSRTSSTRKNNDYTPLLRPSPCVVGRTTVVRENEAKRPKPNTRRSPMTNSATAVRPVSRALAQAVARRRSSINAPDNSLDHLSTDTLPNSTRESATKMENFAEPSSSSSYAEQPVMWSPQLPSQIQVPTDTGHGDEHANYKAPRAIKQRVAHKPTIPKNKHNQPRVPLGVSKKVPIALRTKYLDVVIKEYLNTGHPEEESYSEALKEEQQLANRAANKSIYINLIAGLKKRIREKAGVSTLPKDEDPKYINGNKVVSHSEILTGKVTGTFSIEKKRKSSDPSELGEQDLYDKFLSLVVPVDELELYGYPVPDPNEPTQRKVPLGKDNKKIKLRKQLATTYTCERCTKVYRVDEDGLPLTTTGKCIYHPGHLWNERINRSLEKRYSCCKNDSSDLGCSSNPFHVHKGDLELSNYKGYVETQPKPEREPNKHGIFALDCEMCYTTYGLELTRVTVIDYKTEVVYEQLVKPKNQILDYNTKFSGIKEGDLEEVTMTLEDVQKDLLEKFSSKSILIGHSLDSDMKALKIFHKRFIDTAQLFPHKRGLPFKRALRTLMVENLKTIIQEDAGHDSKEDASAAFRLVMWKVRTDVPKKAT